MASGDAWIMTVVRPLVDALYDSDEYSDSLLVNSVIDLWLRMF